MEGKSLPFPVFWLIDHTESIDIHEKGTIKVSELKQSFGNVPGITEEVSIAGNGAVETMEENGRRHQTYFYLLHSFALGSTQSNVNVREKTLKLQSIPNTPKWELVHSLQTIRKNCWSQSKGKLLSFPRNKITKSYSSDKNRMSEIKH